MASDRPHDLDRPISSIVGSAILFVLRLILTLAFMSPAIAMNLASVQNRGEVMCYASIVLVLSAAFGLHCLMYRPVGQKLFFLIMAPVLILMSMFTAVRNVGGIRETAFEFRQAHITAQNDIKARRVSLMERRKAQSRIAGEDTPKVIQDSIEALKAKYVYRWAATNECQPERVASTEAKTLCNGLRDLQIRLDAAKERDKFQLQIDALDVKAEAPQMAMAIGVPVSNDALLHALDRAGFKMDGSEIDYSYEAGFVLALELIAAGAPIMFGLRLPVFVRRRDMPVVREERAGASLPPVLAAAVEAVTTPASEAIAGATEALRQHTRKASETRARKKRQAQAVSAESAGSVDVWRRQRTVARVGAAAKAQHAYDDYCAWCEFAKVSPVTLSRFGIEQREYGVEKVRRSGAWYYCDIALSTKPSLSLAGGKSAVSSYAMA